MATYKVLQDIEAEDKLVGPLTLRQFIYGIICLFFLYLCFFAYTKHVVFLVVFFLPPALFTGFLATPWRGDQPTEVWALAKLRFLVKPRKRIWDQSGAKQLVTITVPKKIEHRLTNGLSETEVRSRLRALSDTIDSRGWAIKNVNVNLTTAQTPTYTVSDRLVDASILPQEVSSLDVRASDDILDAHTNPVAQQLDTMMHDAATAQRQHLITQLQQPDPTPQTTPQVPQTPAAQTPPADYWFIDQPTTTTASPVSAPATDNAGFAATAVVAPDSDITNLSGVVQAATPTEDEAAYVDVLKAANNQHRAADDHLKHIKTPAEIAAEEQRLAALAAQQQAQAAALAAQKAAEAEAAAAKAQVTSDTQAAIINLANNDDLDVATIARQANKQQAHKQQVRQMNGEVVIPLR